MRLAELRGPRSFVVVDVAVPEVSPRTEVQKARESYLKARASQAMG